MNKKSGIARWTAAGLLAGVLPALCGAQTAADLSRCNALDDNAQRLACYDALSDQGTPPGAVTETAPAVPAAPAGSAPTPAATAPTAAKPPVAAATAPVTTPATRPPAEATRAAEPPVEAVRAAEPPVEAARAADPPIEAARAAERPGAAAPAAEAAGTSEYASLTDDVGAELLHEGKRGESDEPEFRPVRAELTGCRQDGVGKYYFFFENGQVWKQRDNSRPYFGDCELDVTITKDFFGYKMHVDGQKGETRIGRIR